MVDVTPATATDLVPPPCLRTPFPSSYRNDYKYDRVIKVGYVSPDFFTHSVSYFIEGILGQHDKSKFVIYW
jgi:predicted O-linked N-acetylglucosamine transferase (SPINDLY family)